MGPLTTDAWPGTTRKEHRWTGLKKACCLASLSEELAAPLIALAPMRALDLKPILAGAGAVRGIQTLRYNAFELHLLARLEE